MHEIKVRFPQYGKAVFALPGTSLFECLARAGILVRTPCAGAGTCGKCRVRVSEGELPPSPECRRHLNEAEIAAGMRLACRVRIVGEIAVEVPPESLFEHDLMVVHGGGEELPCAGAPLTEKRAVRLTPPTLEAPTADLDGLASALGMADVAAAPGPLRELPLAVRQGGFAVTATLAGNRLITIEPGDTSARHFGLAVDLGTTTIAAALVDLADGRTLGSRGMLNPQVRFGDDVVSRICAQMESEEQREQLRLLAVEAINALARGLCAEAGIASGEITAASIAGNTIMECLFAGIPAGPIGEIPFAPPFRRAQRGRAADFGLALHPEAEVLLFAVIGGFVGGDIVAGIVAAELADRREPVLFVDVGTNGEIVLQTGTELIATAAAAGPAFEGARIAAGMRAAPGAIEKILIGEDIVCNVIADQPPRGICGSALIDAAAELLRVGLIDETGRILDPGECPPGTPPALLARLVADEANGTHDVRLAETPDGKGILLRQKDIRELQLASGAIAAAIAVLLRQAGLAATDLREVLVAGGFGNYIRRSHARRIGLLPPLPDERIRFLGNTSLIGAKAVLRCRDRAAAAEAVAARVRFLDVSLDPDFQTDFANAMLFPADVG
jgi:uncharacterized 2Fe-2S/4Fe-4S cluster protein (DUF4445 family)